MKAFLPLACLLVFLGGCANGQNELQTFTQADATSAAAVATSVGDTQAAACYTAVGAFAAAPTAPGILTKFELFRGAQALAEGPCASVFAGLGIHLLNKIPFTP
jgi:hypothetical protein